MSKEKEKRRTNALFRNKDDISAPLAESKHDMPDSYSNFISELKNRIINQRLKTIMTANASLVLMYWDNGNAILKK